MGRKVIILLMCVVCAIIIIYFYTPRSIILSNIFQPKDLFKPLSEITIDKNNIKKINRSQIRHKYVGIYLVGLYFNLPPDYDSNFDSCGTIELSFKNKNDFSFQKKFSTWRERLGGPGLEKSGVMLGGYRVPDNVKRDEDLEANFVFNIEEKCIQKYGPMTFFIRRGSDF